MSEAKARRAKPAIFVQQSTYRRRRLADAARLLPLLGGILFVIPLLWGTDIQESRTTVVMVYLFIVWAALVGVSGLLSRRLGPEDDAIEDEEQS